MRAFKRSGMLLRPRVLNEALGTSLAISLLAHFRFRSAKARVVLGMPVLSLLSSCGAHNEGASAGFRETGRGGERSWSLPVDLCSGCRLGQNEEVCGRESFPPILALTVLKITLAPFFGGCNRM